MAKKISDEIIDLKIVVNGDEAQKRVSDLEKANNRLIETLELEKQKLKDLQKARKTGTQEYKDAEKAIKKLEASINENKKAINAEIMAMDIMSLTMDQLRTRANQLRYSLNNMNPKHESFKSTQAELNAINERMTTLRTGAGGVGATLRNLSAKFEQYSGVVAGATAVIVGVGAAMQQTIDLNNKMADAFSAVAKTTGMTKEEIKELSEAFASFDTRTSKLDLLKITEIGGRLGVPKEELKDFTREIDKAYVALGDSFSGGVEQVAERLGKVKGLFKETKDLDMATAIAQIGSAMNELGAAGAASEGNIAEFATRVGAMPEALKPTVAEALALGAAFEEGGIDAERSATAYSNFLKSASINTKQFAEVMRLSQAEVEKMINTDPTQFFLTFSEGLKGMSGTELAKVLDYLKINDTYVTSILSNASENTERYRASMQLSNTELQKATSLQKEFNEVNNNAAAIYDKVKKKFIGMFASETVANTLNWLVSAFGKFIGAVEDADGTITGFRNALLMVVKVIAASVAASYSYSAVIALMNLEVSKATIRTGGLTLAKKIDTAMTKTSTLIQAAWNLAVGLGGLAVSKLLPLIGWHTDAIKLQTVAQRRLNLAMSMNPLGVVIALVTTAIALYYTFSDRTDKLAASQKRLAEMESEAADNAAKEITQLDILYKTAKDTTKSLEERNAAVAQLQKMYPNYFANLDAEIIKTGKAEGAYIKLKNAIVATARARAAEKMLEERAAMQLESEEYLMKKINQEKAIAEKYKKDPKGKTEHTVNTGGMFGTTQTITIDHAKTIADAEKKMGIYQKAIKKLRDDEEKKNKPLMDIIYAGQKAGQTLPNNTSLDTKAGGSSYNTDVGGTKEKPARERKPQKSAAEKAAERENRAYEERKKKYIDAHKNLEELKRDLELEAQENAISLMKEGFEKEMAQLDLEEQKKLADLEKRKVSGEQLAQLEEDIKRMTGEEKAKAEALKAAWLDENIAVEEFKIQQQEVFDLKRKALREKQKIKELKENEEHLQKILDQGKREENETIAQLETVAEQKAFLQDKISAKELEKIKTWEQGKTAIQKHYQKVSLDIQREYLESLVKELEALPAVELSDDQIEQLEKLRSKLSEIGVEIAGIKNGNSGEDGKEEFSALASFGGEKDFFGLTADQWDEMFTNIDNLDEGMQRLGAATQIMQNMMSTYHSFVQANAERELKHFERTQERKKLSLQRQLDAGLISQQTYKHQMEAMENEMAMKKWKLEYDAAKREKAMKIAETVSNTAMSIMNIWSKKAGNPIVAAALTAAATALGAVQVATIARQPLPEPPVISGAEEGYYPVIREQDGKLFSAQKKTATSGIYDRPTMLVGEQGKNFPEMVVSGKAMKRIDPKIKSQFMQEVYRAEGFENGLYPTPTSTKNNDELLQKMLMTLEKNNKFLENLETYGVRGVFEKNARNGKDVLEMQKEYTKLLNKNKH